MTERAKAQEALLKALKRDLFASAAPQQEPRNEFVAIDFETADAGRDSACQVAMVRVEEGRIVRRFDTLIRPPRRTFTTSWVHGIEWHHVKDAPTFAEAWPEMRAMLAGAQLLAAHNASFDRSVLRACLAAAGIEQPPLDFVCTVQAARATWSLPRNRLPDVCDHLGIELKHHDAVSDAEACARILIAARAAGYPR